ncbi:MAG: hypothetical protein JSV83_14935 [Desulfobacterales bacterium]|nr:MAG: hypothetical protein JSV83_14935 [Desulfobacterales bacterium]
MEAFKTCTYCEYPWLSREEFLRDPNITLVGYQVNFEELELGLFLFNHETCRTTMAIRAGLFKDLYKGPVFKERQTGFEQCPEYCLHQDILDICREKCECAYVREVLQKVRHWPKHH